jgi:Cft2 family RNA processing exonuclease
MNTHNTTLSCLVLAAGHGQDGVCLLAQMGPYRILLDCGLADISSLLNLEIDAAWCSHAHTDHSQGLIALHQASPQIPLYSSAITAELLAIDFANVLPWHHITELKPGLSAQIFPAGHLPGAAAILLTYTMPVGEAFPLEKRTYKLFYTGDFFLSNTRCTEGLSIEELRGLRPDVLIIEGRHGTARHPHRRQQENFLGQQLTSLLAQHQTIYLLAPQLGQAQELLLLIRSQLAGQKINLWVNEEIATVCDRYLACLPQLPTNIQNFARDRSLFWENKGWPRIHPRTAASATGVYLVTDPTEIPSDQQNLALLITPDLLDGVSSLGLTTHSYFLSVHADGAGTTQLIHNLRPQHVMFVHGSPEYLADLTGLEELHSRYQLHLPAAGSLVELPIGDTFLHAPPILESTYEGELAEGSQFVHVSLPAVVTADARWQKFADTGLVEARWQGEELVLRGISPQQLLNYAASIAPDSSGCGNCQYLRGQRCTHKQSPLHGFKVAATGICGEFVSGNPVGEEGSRDQA